MRSAVFASRLGSLALLAAGLIAGCRDAHGDAVGAESSMMSPLDRLVIGRAMSYPADLSMRDALPELRASQAARRKTAWSIARKVLEPVALDSGRTGADGGLDTTARFIPRFQTWYEKSEIQAMLDQLLRGMTRDEILAHELPTAAAIDEVFAWGAGRARSSADWTEGRLRQRLSEIDRLGTATLGGNEPVLMSPELVGHLYAHYDRILDCIGNVPAPNDGPPSATNFAPCVGEEFPPGAVVVKARWAPEVLPFEIFDTSAEAVSSALASGQWTAASRTAVPGDDAIYTMHLASGMRMRLVALHIATKELRDWNWVSLFWSDTPSADFGADRPADFTGPFANYKMCSVVAYDEEDDGAHATASASLEAAHAATRAFGPRTWCSNPYLEHGPGNAKTNCIGCHQHGGTAHDTASVLVGPLSFPDGSRARSRENFPADYLFVTGTGLGLASMFAAKVAQLTQP